MKDKKELNAVHKHDLMLLLNNLGLNDEFNKGKIKCNFCSDIISERNFGTIYSNGSHILFTCSKSECLEKVARK